MNEENSSSYEEYSSSNTTIKPDSLSQLLAAMNFAERNRVAKTLGCSTGLDENWNDSLTPAANFFTMIENRTEGYCQTLRECSGGSIEISDTAKKFFELGFVMAVGLNNKPFFDFIVEDDCDGDVFMFLMDFVGYNYEK